MEGARVALAVSSAVPLVHFPSFRLIFHVIFRRHTFSSRPVLLILQKKKVTIKGSEVGIEEKRPALSRGPGRPFRQDNFGGNRGGASGHRSGGSSEGGKRAENGGGRGGGRGRGARGGKATSGGSNVSGGGTRNGTGATSGN